jgi:L-rhamnose isomerase
MNAILDSNYEHSIDSFESKLFGPGIESYTVGWMNEL